MSVSKGITNPLLRFRTSQVISIILLTFLSGCATVNDSQIHEITELTYSSPINVATGSSCRFIYIAEKTAKAVSVIDRETSTNTKKIPLPLPPSGLALSKDETLLYVSGSAPEGKVYVIDLADYTIRKTISVGHSPSAPVISPDGKTLYVCNRFDNTVSVIDIWSGKETKTINVLREPVAAVITPDGRYLFVANYLPIGPMPGDYRATFVTVIEARTNLAIKNIQLIYGAISVQGLCVSPDGKYVYATHTLARYKYPTEELERGNINKSALVIINVNNLTRLNTVLLDDTDLGAANPWGIDCGEDGRYLCIAHSGTHEISVIDRNALHDKLDASDDRRNQIPDELSFLSGTRRRIMLHGKGPRGLSVSGNTVFIAEYFSNSLGVVDFTSIDEPEIRSIPLGRKKEMTTVRRGEMLFHDASICFQQWQSCASCHPGEGRSDALNWDLLNDGTGNPKSTKSLLLSHRTPPSMATGIREKAEIAVRAGFTNIERADLPEEDLAAVDEYLKSLTSLPSPYLIKGELSRAAKRGEKLFTLAGCINCHPAPLYTDMRIYDVGTGSGDEAGVAFDTPTLIEVWRTHPYLIDGTAATIRQVLKKFNPNDRHGRTSQLSDEQIEDLAEYVLSL